MPLPSGGGAGRAFFRFGFSTQREFAQPLTCDNESSELGASQHRRKRRSPAAVEAEREAQSAADFAHPQRPRPAWT